MPMPCIIINYVPYTQGRCKECQIAVNQERQRMCPPKQKKCTLCRHVKPATEFNKDNNCSDGLKVSALCPG